MRDPKLNTYYTKIIRPCKQYFENVSSTLGKHSVKKVVYNNYQKVKEIYSKDGTELPFKLLYNLVELMLKVTCQEYKANNIHMYVKREKNNPAPPRTCKIEGTYRSRFS